ncbi:hypothetical protein IKF23_03750 [Candidatus Saccharibacteria bacterium]|nr:hypothetical protein [Candidatus Saccharibacteria bacterium]
MKYRKKIVFLNIIGLLACFFVSLFPAIAHAESLDYSVTIDPSINITIPTNVVALELNPLNKTFSYQDLGISVSTNNSLGYKLTMDSTNHTTNLVNILDSTKTIPTLPIAIGSTSGTSITSYTESNFKDNAWGYKIGTITNPVSSDTNNYLPFIPGTTIAINHALADNDTTTLRFASKINYEQPAGLYTINLNFNATVNPTNPPYMQNLDPSLCVANHSTLVVDSRDERSYYIRRLKDGKCWMVQNLRLGQDLTPVTGALVLTEQDTDISSTDTYNPRSQFVLTNQVADGKMPAKNVYDQSVSANGYIWDDSAFYCTNDYGCYYNFYTATAGVTAEGERAVITQNTDVSTTICPKGWTMPTGGNVIENHLTADYYELIKAYKSSGDSGATLSRALLVDPIINTENTNGESAPGFVLAGGYYVGGGNLFGERAYYQSRTIRSLIYGYDLLINTSSQSWTDFTNRVNGRPVRCLLQE